MDEQAVKFGAQVRSDNYSFQSKLAKQNASNAMTGGYFGALAQGIGGVTRLTNPYQQYGAYQRYGEA
jgi:hypothetical protein